MAEDAESIADEQVCFGFAITLCFVGWRRVL